MEIMALEEGKDPIVSLIYRYVIDNVLLSLEHSTAPSFLPSEIKQLEAAWINTLQAHNAVLDINTWALNPEPQPRTSNPPPTAFHSSNASKAKHPATLPAKRLRENEADFFGPFAPLVHQSPHLPVSIRDDVIQGRTEAKVVESHNEQEDPGALGSVGDAPPVLNLPQVDGINDVVDGDEGGDRAKDGKEKDKDKENGEGSIGGEAEAEEEEGDESDLSDLDDEFLEQMRAQQRCVRVIDWTIMLLQ